MECGMHLNCICLYLEAFYNRIVSKLSDKQGGLQEQEHIRKSV